MSFSETYADSITFTLTHARHIGAKVATDLRRIQRLYNGQPSDSRIAEFETEIVAHLKAGYLDTVTYGYRRSDDWIEPTLRYTAQDLAGGSADDDDPGRVRPGANIEGASFHSYLIRNAAWHALSAADRAAFQSSLPFERTGQPEPGISGYLSQDRSYSAGGSALIRASVRSY
jgi:Bacterial HORMA domain family 1